MILYYWPLYHVLGPARSTRATASFCCKSSTLFTGVCAHVCACVRVIIMQTAQISVYELKYTGALLWSVHSENTTQSSWLQILFESTELREWERERESGCKRKRELHEAVGGGNGASLYLSSPRSLLSTRLFLSSWAPEISSIILWRSVELSSALALSQSSPSFIRSAVWAKRALNGAAKLTGINKITLL